MSACFLTCFALIPLLAAGERFLFGDCPDYEDVIDPIGETEDGLIMLQKLGKNPKLSVILWDSSGQEAGNRCMRLKYDLELGVYEFSYIDRDGVRSQARGSAQFTVTPKTTKLKLSGSSGEGGLKKNVLSASTTGQSELFPVYISHKELLLLSCSAGFLGRFETLYVLTTEDISSLNLECARTTIRAATGRPVTAPISNCSGPD